MTDRPTFILELRPEGRDPLDRDVATRLKLLLKLARRSCGLVCTSIREAGADGEDEHREDGEW